MNSQMDSAMSGGDQEDQKRQGLVTVNDLNYTLEPDLSVAVNRTGKKHFFQTTEYQHNQQGICILNSGADYIDTRTSYLSFEVELPADIVDTAGFFGAHGSACNLIDTLTISTRSGDELCRLSEFGLLQNMLIPATYDSHWIDTVGSTMGYGGKVNARLSPEYATNGKQRFLIPMYVLAPLFGYGRLMPAMLMSGLRFLFQWAPPEKAFMALKDTAGTVGQGIQNALNTLPANVEYPATKDLVFSTTIADAWDKQSSISSYKVKNAYFYLTSIQLSDSIQRALNEQSATNGLEIVYSDFERTESVYTGAANLCNVEVRKSCSRALKAFCRVRCQTSTTEEKNRDSFRSEKGFPWREYQWQLGSLYFPQQPVRSQADNIYGVGPEAFAQLMETMDKYTDSAQQPTLTYDGKGDSNVLYSHLQDVYSDFNLNTPIPAVTGNAVADINASNSAMYYLTTAVAKQSVSRQKQKGAIVQQSQTPFANQGTVQLGQYGSYMNDQHTIAVNLERTSLFSLAGVPVNNSRVLAFRALLHDASHEPTAARGVSGAYAPGVDKFTGYVKEAVKSRSFTIYLKYVKLCRIFLNNVEVEQ